MKTACAVRPVVRLAILAVAAAVALIGTAGGASAHVSVESATPADGASVTIAPSEVALEFSGSLLGVTSVRVTAPDGSSVAAGEPVHNGPSVFQALGPLTATGRYTVTYVVVASDSDEVTGSLSFTFDGTPAATAAAGTTAAAAVSAPAGAAAAGPTTSSQADPDSADPDSEDEGRDAGGVVIGSVIVLAFLAGLFFLVTRLRRK